MLQTAPTGRAAWLNLLIVPVPSRVLEPPFGEVCQSRKRWHFDDDESVGCCTMPPHATRGPAAVTHCAPLASARHGVRTCRPRRAPPQHESTPVYT